MKTFIQFCIPCLLLMMACKKDKLPTSIDFVVHNALGGGGPLFVLISNQDGEILYDSLGEFINNTISFKAELTDQIDATYGFVDQASETFRITTYRDIKSGFDYKNFLDRPCQPKINLESEQNSWRYLTIDGLINVEEIYFPTPWRPQQATQELGSTYILQGTDGSKADHLITVRTGNGEYRSKLVRHEDWIPNANFDNNLTIHYDDFVPTKVHILELPTFGYWKVEAHLQEASGRVIRTNKWHSFHELATSENIIRLFTLDEIQVSQLFLEVDGYSVDAFVRHVQSYDDFPQSIVFPEQGIEALDLRLNNYDFEVDHDFALLSNQIYYDFDFDFSTPRWRIYQKQESGLDYTLPEIPEYILAAFGSLRADLETPTHADVEVFKAEDKEAFLNAYNRASIDLQWDCLNFASYKVSFTF
ncbi:MAG: hypothetical protein AAF985_10320 [Bacteroidota bacterium]